MKQTAFTLALVLVLHGFAIAKPQRAASGMRRHSDARVSFDFPEELKVEPTSDVSADHALALTGSKEKIGTTVLVGPTGARDADNLFELWHNARVKNRVAWGMRSDGGPPRETVHVGDRRLLRQRDRIGGSLSTNEQTMSCGIFSTRFVCVITSAPIGSRELADAVAQRILSSLETKR